MKPKLLPVLLLLGGCPIVMALNPKPRFQKPLSPKAAYPKTSSPEHSSTKCEDILQPLFADQPAAQYKDQLMLFGQLVGEWQFEGIEYNPDGRRPTDKGEIHFAWILQGRAIQDLWIEHERSDTQRKIYGTTVRIYDPGIDAWRITWMDPVYGAVQSLIGRKAGDEIVMEGKNAEDNPIRWIFSQVTPSSFHWRAEKLVGDTWQKYEELSAHRKK